MKMKEHKLPLVVDLDGTLIKTDILIETLIQYFKINIFNFMRFFFLLFKGKSVLKSEVAKVINIDVAILPYNKDVIDYIKREKKSGRRVVLATATNMKYAVEISNYLGVFDEVIASNDKINLASINKANELINRFGECGFDYVGNSHADIKVWSKAANSIVVNPDRGVLAKAKAIGNVTSVIDNRPNFLRTLIKALRVHQWAKNVLILVPLAAAHQLTDMKQLTTALMAFLLFSLCASTVYLLNDLLDLEDDRHHKKKYKRPFASGELDLRLGVILIPFLLLVVALCSALYLPFEFVVVLATYYVLTLLYSFKLKQVVMLDVIMLALLYTIRIVAGGAVLGIDLTFWLLAFSMFIFLSLALVKRYAELYAVKQDGDIKARGRGYHSSDLELISSLGASSGYLSVLVLSLYINQSSTVSMYTQPMLIWLACPLLLFWISRTWLLTHRGQMHDDPVLFAIKDKVSLYTGLILFIIFYLAA